MQPVRSAGASAGGRCGFLPGGLPAQVDPHAGTYSDPGPVAGPARHVEHSGREDEGQCPMRGDREAEVEVLPRPVDEAVDGPQEANGETAEPSSSFSVTAAASIESPPSWVTVRSPELLSAAVV